MFKLALTSALLAFACAQDLQSLANEAVGAAPALGDLNAQANSAVAQAAPVLSQNNPLSQADNGLALSLDNYEWVLTEVASGEYNLEISQLASNLNNVAPTLAALLSNVGNVFTNNNEEVIDVLDAEAASLGVSLESAGLAGLISQAGSQLNDNAGSLGDLAANNLNNGASAAQDNSGAVNSAVNGAINNQQGLSDNVSHGVNDAVDALSSNNAASLASAVNGAGLPVSVSSGDLSQAASAAGDAAQNAVGNVDTNQAAATLQDLAGQGAAAGQQAIDNNLPSGIAGAANGVAQTAASSASNSVNSAAGSLNANAVDNLNSATNLINGV